MVNNLINNEHSMELLSSSTPTLNARIVHTTLHYILLSVSAYVGARRSTSAPSSGSLLFNCSIFGTKTGYKHL